MTRHELGTDGLLPGDIVHINITPGARTATLYTLLLLAVEPRKKEENMWNVHAMMHLESTGQCALSDGSFGLHRYLIEWVARAT